MLESDYRLVNILLILGLVGTLLFIAVRSYTDPVSCMILQTTDSYCVGCGLTRDFQNFLHLDISNPINAGSLPLLLYYLIQIALRTYTALRFDYGGYAPVRGASKLASGIEEHSMVAVSWLVLDVIITIGGAMLVISFF